MNKLIKNILLFTIAGILGLMIVVIAILWTFSSKLPDYKFLKNYKPPVSSKLYSGAGELVSDFSSEKRIFVPYNVIPEKVINAFYLPKIRIFLLIQELMQKEFLELLSTISQI